MPLNVRSLAPWLLTAALGVWSIALARERAVLKQRATEHMQQAELLTQWVQADEAFIDGDRERATALYVAIAQQSGDSTLYQQRTAYYAAIDSGMGQGERRNDDYARLAQRLARAERQLAAARLRRDAAGDNTAPDDVIDPDTVILPYVEEIARLRVSLDRSRERGLVRFPSAKNREGVTYVGATQNGEANGFGYGVWETGSSYEGEWVNNMRHGDGVFRWKDGEWYEGRYENDLRTGPGIYHWKDGRRWDGEWLDDMRHGDGMLYEANGKVRVRGVWEKDKLVREIKD